MKKVNNEVDSSPISDWKPRSFEDHRPIVILHTVLKRSTVRLTHPQEVMGSKPYQICFSFIGLFFILDMLKKVNSEVDSSPISDGINNLWDLFIIS